MSTASHRAASEDEDRFERWRPWIAASLTALLHLLLLLVVLLSPPITFTAPPEGSAAGSRAAVTEVSFIDSAPPSPAPPRTKPASKPKARKPVETPPATARVQTTLVSQADARVSQDERLPDPEVKPAELAETAQQPQATASVERPPPPTQHRDRNWGKPPGMLSKETAPTNLGLGASPTANTGRTSRASSDGPNLSLGGYQVYYDLANEARLQAWRDQGMTELSLPLPGIKELMVCPLETALKRESGPCRLVAPDSPELKTIGDARQVINMKRVYKLGEMLWSGPRPYR